MLSGAGGLCQVGWRDRPGGSVSWVTGGYYTRGPSVFPTDPPQAFPARQWTSYVGFSGNSVPGREASSSQASELAMSRIAGM